MTNIALVNDAIHERINKGREDSHINILSWTSFMIVSTPLNFLCQIVDVGQGRQRNGLCSLTYQLKYIVIDLPIIFIAKIET